MHANGPEAPALSGATVKSLPLGDVGIRAPTIGPLYQLEEMLTKLSRSSHNIQPVGIQQSSELEWNTGKRSCTAVFKSTSVLPKSQLAAALTSL